MKTPTLDVRIKGGSVACPICSTTVYISTSDLNQLTWQGRGCPHLKSFDFYRIGPDVYAVFRRA